MTGAERQRRYVLGQRGTAPAAAPASQLQAENAQLKTDCAKLKAEIANLKQTPTPAQASELEAQCAKLKDENTKLKMQLAGAHHQIRELAARRPQSSPKPKPPPRTQSEIEQQLRKQVSKLRGRLRMIIHSPVGSVVVKPGSRRKILAALHPDGVLDPAVKKRLEIAFQIISELFDKKKLIEIEEEA
jgi:hypothetical protein